MSVLSEGRFCASIEVHLRFLQPAIGDHLTADTHVVRAGKRIVSLESRVPLLSPELVRFASRLPDRATEASRPSKWVLREVLAQSLPAELIDAPKSGFGLPIDNWLRRDLRAWAEELLSPGALDESGLAPGPIRQVWHQHLAGSVDAGSELWTVLAYQRWRAANR